MKLLTATQARQMLANGRWNTARIARHYAPTDFRPVVRLFTETNPMSWLLSELDPKDPDIAFGLCVSELDCATFRSVRLSSLLGDDGTTQTFRRDRHFHATMTLGAYAAQINEQPT